MRLLQAGWPIPFWSKRQTCFATAGIAYCGPLARILSPCLRLRLAFCDESRMHIVARRQLLWPVDVNYPGRW
ncbi:hypothetical protein, partial [Thauera sp.]|uniref:hypothetical protein n=1 Tax=Thauera sp. TaxID=1905334 RepID=UPI002B705D1F